MSREFAGLLEESVPVYVDDRGQPVVALTRYGKGAFVLVSSGWLFSNKGLGEADNLAFVLNVVYAAHADKPSSAPRLLFDEYHHGYGARETLWTIAPTPVKLGLIQLTVALLLLVFSLSRRLTAPVPLPGQERARAEYLTSMATLLQRAGATGAALGQAHEAFRAQACSRLGLPAGAGTAAIVAAVRPRSRGLALRVKSALERAELLEAHRRPPVDLVLAAVQNLYTLRKELEHLS